jgi:hypothetical protein
MFEQHHQDAERLLVKTKLDPVLAQFGSLQVEFERTETDAASQ